MTHHNQTNELTTWFLNLLLDESTDNKKHKVWSSNPKHHEAQLEDQKGSRMSFKRRKSRKANKKHKKRQAKQNGKEELRKAQKKTKRARKGQNQRTPPESTPP
jgi:hypothetical protein